MRKTRNFQDVKGQIGDEDSAVMCKSRIEGPGTSYKLLKVPYFLWLTTGALVSVTLTVNNLNVFFLLRYNL